MTTNKNYAFTLAEILVTLGIIGVVAALTMPALIANHKKQVVISRMQKFYTTINQAVKFSEAENGDAADWQSAEYLDAESLYDFWNTYMAKYFVGKNIIKASDGILIILSDGSGFGLYNPSIDSVNGIDWLHIVYCVDFKSCQNHLKKSNNKIYQYPLDGKNTFLFLGSKNSVITYGSNISRKRNELINSTGSDNYGCADSYKAYCAALIEYDGWKINKDYPVHF
mgnify:FL=1